MESYVIHFAMVQDLLWLFHITLFTFHLKEENCLFLFHFRGEQDLILKWILCALCFCFFSFLFLGFCFCLGDKDRASWDLLLTQGSVLVSSSRHNIWYWELNPAQLHAWQTFCTVYSVSCPYLWFFLATLFGKERRPGT